MQPDGTSEDPSEEEERMLLESVAMNHAIDMPLHMGPEFERAINRTDFFRLHKSATRASGFEYFVLMQHIDRMARFTPASHFILTNVPEGSKAGLARALSTDESGIFSAMHAAAAPFSHAFPYHWFDPRAEQGTMSCAVLLPLHSPEGKRYWLMMAGMRSAPDRRELAELMLDSMRIFSRLHEKVLASDDSSHLTAREIEVLKWTSEGKTSAEIAIILGLSEHTVISHITSSARKLNAVNRVHLVAIAVRKGIVF